MISMKLGVPLGGFKFCLKVFFSILYRDLFLRYKANLILFKWDDGSNLTFLNKTFFSEFNDMLRAYLCLF
jgi:hypothetical protein